MKQSLFYLVASVSSALLFSACQKQDLRASDLDQSSASKKSINANATKLNEKTNTFYGPQVHVGDGKARSWIRITHSGVPKEIGIEMTEGTLTGLPHDHESWVLPIHQKAKAITPFDHVYFNWNPHGHPPEIFFSAPHFDIHFYMTSVEARESIPAYSEASDASFNNYPPSGYMPADYSTPPGINGAEIAMGKHWLPPPPTFLPFTKVMILGTYDGHFTFIEPMITQSFLKSKTNSSQSFSQPTLFEHTGKYYPTVMNVFATDNKHHISLSNFVLR